MIVLDKIQDKHFLSEWIKKHSDNQIKYITLERQIIAFYLLEELVKMDVDFIFKGGTALILLLNETKRFSTDIDILISKPNMEKLESQFNDFVKTNKVFKKFEIDLREDSNFPKAHYKFYFDSINNNQNQDGYILLDAVFEGNPYMKLEKKEIKNDILICQEPFFKVSIPSLTDIMIDKLTAFTPSTIGVKFERVTNRNEIKDHTREVIKQWFDINELYLKCYDFDNLTERYDKLSDFEIKQRKLEIDYLDCLHDTVKVILSFLSQGKTDINTFEKIKRGIRKLDSFVNLNLNQSYMISASVNVLELISKVLCDDKTEYQRILKKSKDNKSYTYFIKDNKLKDMLNIVKANNLDDRDRFIISLRILSNYLNLFPAKANL